MPTVTFVHGDPSQSMHDGNITEGDTWVKNTLGGYAEWAKTHNSELIVTWDEDDFTTANHIPRSSTAPSSTRAAAARSSTTTTSYTPSRTTAPSARCSSKPPEQQNGPFPRHMGEGRARFATRRVRSRSGGPPGRGVNHLARSTGPCRESADIRRAANRLPVYPYSQISSVERTADLGGQLPNEVIQLARSRRSPLGRACGRHEGELRETPREAVGHRVLSRVHADGQQFGASGSQKSLSATSDRCYSVRSAVAVRERAAQPAGSRAPSSAIAIPPASSGSSIPAV
ncbi:hypothetical protein E6W39_11475 [Kitasatospora acidiphila]|uniref:Uncharacterized protein n=1 Tax=Kitasatospora acidiphila TaxID=2567942 RepID=A0A540WE04_9ACTN|nr:hypothetical protein E6W39_11475 [Kitasatospora acidiphila]